MSFTMVAGIARLVAEALSRAEALTALQVDASSLEACLFVLAHMGAAVTALASISAAFASATIICFRTG